MSNFRYKAYISYSHHDETWATWLHRVLESYRVPHRLVGQIGQFGVVPASLSPIFRDRDDLSSATDLSEKLKSALAESESLIIICSPASAQSQWVNEEIRQFRILGRGDRIFCVIVDGDPASTDPDHACFPPALLKSADGQPHEPLAADIRKWADGKNLAKLKLVAGILGIRLDKLLRRDVRRKRKIKIVAGLAIAAVVALAASAFQARMAEQEALYQQQKDRDNAEVSLAKFIEATDNLDQVANLQTRRIYAELAPGFLQNLDPDNLSLESKRNLGRILQHQGEINVDEGNLQLAMDLFVESREILDSIYKQNPNDGDAIFDLSQVEWYIGDIFYRQGNFEQAARGFSAYRDASQKLIQLDPDNAKWIMEMSYALSNLAAIEKSRIPPDFRAALGFYQVALQYSERAAALDESWNTELGGFHGDVADAWLGICELSEALSERLEEAQYAEQHYQANPGNNRLKRTYAFALAGLANVQRMTGTVEPALSNLLESVELLDQLYLEDKTKLQYRWNLFRKSSRAAHLMSLNGQPDKAWDWYLEIEEIARGLINDDKHIGIGNSISYSDFLFKYAETAVRTGNQTKANQLLDEATDQLQSILDNHPHEFEALELLSQVEFYRWAQDNNHSPNTPTSQSRLPEEVPDRPQSCEEIDARARQAVMSGNKAQAKEYSSLLLANGYKEPEYMLFCAEYKVCAE